MRRGGEMKLLQRVPGAGTTAAIVCAIVGCAAYLSSLDCGLCFDDETAIMKNGDLRPSSPWSNLLSNDFWGKSMDSVESHKSYRPLTVATFRLNYMLHELEPLGYHLVNVLLHGAVCYLYVLLCGVVFSEVWPALIAGLLFAVHPIHTEAVAGLVGRAELLSALFFIGSFLAYRRAALKSGSNGEGKWVGASILLCLCSSLSKEQGVTVLAVCLVYDYLVLQKMDLRSTLQLVGSVYQSKFTLPARLRAMGRRAAFLIAFLTLFMVFRLRLMNNAPLFPGITNPAATMLDPPYRQLHWSYLASFNGWLLLSPSRLSPEYAGSTIPLVASFTDSRNLNTLATFLSVILLGVYTVTRTRNDLRKRASVCGLALLLLPYLPASNLFFPVGFVVAERVLYLPSMGFCLLVGYGAYTLTKTTHHKLFSYLVKIAIFILLLLHFTKTVLQNRAWLSEKDLYLSSVRSYPANGKMWHNLGAQFAQGEVNLTQSELMMWRSIEAEPNYIISYSDLGLLLTRRNKKEEAEKMLRRAIELLEAGVHGSRFITVSKKDIQAYVKLASLIKTNHTRMEEALQLCQTALAKVPDDFRATREMGQILLMIRKSEEAKTYLERAIQLSPSEPNAHYLLGMTHAELGDLARADASIRRALALVSDRASQLAYMVHLGVVLYRKGELEEAERILHQSVSQNPYSVDGWYSLGLVHRESGRAGQAEESFSNLLQLSPSHEAGLVELSKLKLERGDRSSAEQLLRSALQINPGNTEARAVLASLSNHR